MPDRTTEPTLGELMRAVERIDGRLDRLAQSNVTLDRFADRNTIVQEKIEQLVRLLEQEAAQRQIEQAAEEASRKAADDEEKRERIAGDEAITKRLDKAEDSRTTTTRYLLAGIVTAVGTSLWDVLRGGLGG